jgi:hypothetical protein
MVCEDVINCELEGQGREESRLITRCYANIRLASLRRGVNVGASKDLNMCVDLVFMAVRIRRFEEIRVPDGCDGHEGCVPVFLFVVYLMTLFQLTM